MDSSLSWKMLSLALTQKTVILVSYEMLLVISQQPHSKIYECSDFVGMAKNRFKVDSHLLHNHNFDV
jgi:hypothetical protein